MGKIPHMQRQEGKFDGHCRFDPILIYETAVDCWFYKSVLTEPVDVDRVRIFL